MDIVGWLEEQISEFRNEEMEYKYLAEEYEEALEQYKKKGSLPRDIRSEAKRQGIVRR